MPQNPTAHVSRRAPSHSSDLGGDARPNGGVPTGDRPTGATKVRSHGRLVLREVDKTANYMGKHSPKLGWQAQVVTAMADPRRSIAPVSNCRHSGDARGRLPEPQDSSDRAEHPGLNHQAPRPELEARTRGGAADAGTGVGVRVKKVVGVPVLGGWEGREGRRGVPI